MRARNCQSIRLFWAKDEPGNLFRIYKSSTKKTEREMELLCLAFSSKKSRRFQCSVSYQECKLPVCQHCRKLGNHSAGVWVEAKTSGTCRAVPRFYGLKIGNPQKVEATRPISGVVKVGVCRSTSDVDFGWGSMVAW